MRTFRKKSNKKLKARKSKPKTRRVGRGVTPDGMELKTYKTNQPSEECKRLQEELNNKTEIFFKYRKAMEKYNIDYDKWYSNNLEEAYYGRLDWSSQPTRPAEPPPIKKEFIDRVKKACGKHFVEEI